MDGLTLFDEALEPRAQPMSDGSRRQPEPPGRAEPAPSHPSEGAGAHAHRPSPLLLAIDGDSLAHRAYHAYAAGRGGRYGFLALLAAVCDQVAADALLVGFDCRVRSARRDREPGYKAQRSDKAPDLIALLEQLPTDLTALGLTVGSAEGWEADDMVASAASAAERRGWRCAVATSDRDAYALASETTTVLRLRNAGETTERITPRRLRRKVGVDPGRYVSYAALRGDASDNLPGILGIGPRRAAALLAAFDDAADADPVEAAGADPIGCKSVLGRAAGQALLDDLASGSASVYRRNVALMQVRRDLPTDLDAARRRPQPDDLAARLKERGLGALAGRLAAAVCARPELAPPPDAPPEAPPDR